MHLLIGGTRYVVQSASSGSGAGVTLHPSGTSGQATSGTVYASGTNELTYTSGTVQGNQQVLQLDSSAGYIVVSSDNLSTVDMSDVNTVYQL